MKPMKFWAETDADTEKFFNYLLSIGVDDFIGWSDDVRLKHKDGGIGWFTGESGCVTFSVDEDYFDSHRYEQFFFPIPVKFMEVKLFGETLQQIEDNFKYLEDNGYSINQSCLIEKSVFLACKSLTGDEDGNIVRGYCNESGDYTYEEFLKESGEHIDLHGFAEKYGQNAEKHSHYKKDVSHLQFIDVYRVLELYNVTSPCIQHAIKKLLVAGGRGAGKDVAQDIAEAKDSLVRWQDMKLEDKQ